MICRETEERARKDFRVEKESKYVRKRHIQKSVKYFDTQEIAFLDVKFNF